MWEEILIGTLIADPDVYDEVYGVTPLDFSSTSNRIIWSYAMELASQGSLSHRSLLNLLRTDKEIDNIGNNEHRGEEYIFHLITQSDIPGVKEAAKQVRNASDTRRLIEIGSLLVQKAKTGADAQELLREHIKTLVSMQRSVREPKLLAAVNPLYEERMMKLVSGEQVPFWEPPFEPLKKKIRQLEFGDFGLIIAPTGTGKSSLLRFLALETALMGKRVLMVTLENTEEETHSWAISQIANVNHYHVIDQRRASPEEKERIEQAKRRLEETPYMISEMAIANIDDVTSTIRSAVLKDPYDLVLVDGVYLIAGNRDSAYDRISVNTQTLRGLAQEIKTPVIGSSQMKRGSRRKPSLDPEDILYAGENPSRILWALKVKDDINAREAAYFQENLYDGTVNLRSLKTVVAWVEVLKATNGETGPTEEFAWRKGFNTFEALPSNWRNDPIVDDRMKYSVSVANSLAQPLRFNPKPKPEKEEKKNGRLYPRRKTGEPKVDDEG